MKNLMLAAVFSVVAATAYAGFNEPSSCKSQSAGKNLHGAAEKSFLTKCEKDAKASCDNLAAEKSLRGAAKDSFVKKCINDAVGI